MRLASEKADLEAPIQGSWEQRFLELAAQIRRTTLAALAPGSVRSR